MRAIFLGIKDSKNVSKEDMLSRKCIYQFKVGNEIKEFAIDDENKNYSIRNKLMIGYEYDIELEEDRVLSAILTSSIDVEGIVDGYNPGERTIKNFLMTSLGPLGKTLYVYGGGWNVQDEGSSKLTTTIGVSPTWEKFYSSVDENYSYTGTTYPTNEWNEYYYAGLDCSAYVGWTLYNTMNSVTSENGGFVNSSTKMAKLLSEGYNYGEFKHPNTSDYKTISKSFHPGDIVSIDGHVYIVIGTCSDNSVVIIHSTVSPSITGISGGGVQMSAININGDNDTNCEAYRLAKSYMEEYYGDWAQRYPVVVKPVSVYFSFPDDKESTGIFSWYSNDNGLNDPDGIRYMNASDVLETIFSEKLEKRR